MNRNLLIGLGASGMFLLSPQTAFAQTGIYVLNPTEQAVFSGSVEIAANTINVDSSNSKALNVNGHSGAIICNAANVVGGIDTPGQITGEINTGTSPVGDPLASLPVPSVGADLGGFSGSGTATLSPGYYSEGFDLSGGGDLTLLPGVYVLDGVGLDLAGLSKVHGTGVMLYFKGTAELNMAGGAVVDLSPPFGGVYDDVLFFFDRDNDNPVDLNGGANIKMRGKLYFPASHVEISGAAGVTNTAFGFLLVCDTLVMNGGGAIQFYRLPSPEEMFD